MIGIRPHDISKTDRRQVMVQKHHEKQAQQQQQQQQPMNQHDVEFNSILRIRPLKSKEKEDHVVLEKTQQNGLNVAILHPLLHITSPQGSVGVGSPNFIHEGHGSEFHFHKILESASQESIFYAMGLSMASTAMEPLKMKGSSQAQSSVVVAMGNAESGKSHSIFGKLVKNSTTTTSQEGLIPRMLESFFSQSKHHVSSNKTFGVRMVLLLVEKNEVVRDLLADPSTQNHHNGTNKKSAVMAMVASFEKPDSNTAASNGSHTADGIAIEQDPITNDFCVDTSYVICRSSAEAREMLHMGLSRSQTSRLMGKSSSLGHVVVVLQPVLLNRTNSIDRFGGTICMVDLASKEKGKKARMTKDSISSDSTTAALMHCFRTMKNNKNVMEGRTSMLDHSFDGSEISCVSEPKVPTVKAVPWRQSKVTMLLQPFFSSTAPLLGDRKHRQSNDGTTSVTLLMNAYPGHRDYAEKRSILSDLEKLQGQEIARSIVRQAQTGCDPVTNIKTPPASVNTRRNNRKQLEVQKLDLSNDEEMYDHAKENNAPNIKRQKRTDPVKATAPAIHEEDFAPLPPPMAPSHNPVGISDFPGVALPSPPSHNTESPPSLNPQYKPNTRSRAKESVQQAKRTSHDRKIGNGNRDSAHTEVVATAVPKDSLNVQPPLEKKKNSWMQSSTVKTFATAVNVGKQQGMRALTTIDKMTRSPGMLDSSNASALHDGRAPSSRHVTARMKTEFDVDDDVAQTALIQKLKKLELQNARLTDRNMELESKCEELESDKKALVQQLRETRRQGRQEQWTQQDEHAWRHSRKNRLQEQDLIGGSLQEHLARVEQTHQINNRWQVSNKQHYALAFPQWWKGAKELDQRDRTLDTAIPQPQIAVKATTPVKRLSLLVRKLSGEKRVEKKLSDVEKYKRLKKY